MTKIRTDRFKATAPKIDARILPENMGQTAVDVSLRSGALKPYRTYSTPIQQPTKSGFVKTIYGFDPNSNGDVKWLHWSTTDAAHPDGLRGYVEVEEGFDVTNTNIRYYYTGTDVPRETTTTLAKTGSGTNYPITHYKLGTPNPTSKPVVTPLDPASITYTVFNTGTLAGLTVNPTIDDGTQLLKVSESSGKLLFEQDALTSASPSSYVYQDVGIINKGLVGAKATFDISNGQCYLVLGASPTGRGGAVVKMYEGGGVIYWSLSQFSAYGELYVDDGGSFPFSGSTTSFSAASPFDLSLLIDFSQSTSKVYLTVKQGATTVNLLNGYSPGVNIPLAGGTVGAGMLTSITGLTMSVTVDTLSFFTEISDASVLTNYVYTWVSTKDGLDEESGPSPVSNDTFFTTTDGVTLTGITAPSPTQISEYNITKKYLYRAVTGSSGTVYQFVAEIPLATTTYTDNIATSDLELTFLESEGWQLPPTDGRYITALPNGIMLIASGRYVYPSVKYRPHAYPLSFGLSVDSDIKGIRVMTSSFTRENEGTAVIVTATSVYILAGTSPETLTLSRISANYGSLYPRSITSWKDYGVLFSSPVGLIAVTGTEAKNLTADFALAEQWSAFFPNQAMCTVYDNMFYGIYEGIAGGFTFDPEVGLCNISVGDVGVDFPAAIWQDVSRNRLYYLLNANTVREWNAGNTYKSMSWKSKVYRQEIPTAFMMCQIDTDVFPITLELFYNQSPTPYFTKTVTSDVEFVITPKVCREFEYKITTSAGSVPTEIHSIQFVENMEDLN